MPPGSPIVSQLSAALLQTTVKLKVCVSHSGLQLPSVLLPCSWELERAGLGSSEGLSLTSGGHVLMTLTLMEPQPEHRTWSFLAPGFLPWSLGHQSEGPVRKPQDYIWLFELQLHFCHILHHKQVTEASSPEVGQRFSVAV